MRISIILLGVFSLCCLSSLMAADPAWWTDSATAIIDPNASHAIEDNYHPVNLGQLKNFATKAKQRLDAVLPGGAGPAVDARLAEFSGSIESNYSPVNLGQLKYVAEPFYNRLREAWYNLHGNLIVRGYPISWEFDTPWNPNTPASDNYLPANLGQLKLVFSFDPDDETVYDGTNRKLYYVDSSLSTSGNGNSPITAFKTIQEAANAAEPGDKIKIAGGIYRESVTLNHGGTSDLDTMGNPIGRIVFEGAGNVIVCGSDEIPGEWTVWNEAPTGSIGTIWKRNWGVSSPEDPTTAAWQSVDFYHFTLPGEILSHSDIIALVSEQVDLPNGRILMPTEGISLPAGPTYGIPFLANTLWSFYIDRTVDPHVIYVALPHGRSMAEFQVEAAVRRELFHGNANAALGYDGSGRSVQCITLRGLRFLYSCNYADGYMMRGGPGWIVENCVFEGANGGGFDARGFSGNPSKPVDNIKFVNCRAFRNGAHAFLVGGVDQLQIIDCSFAFNGWKGFNPVWSGSNKFWLCHDVSVLGCKSYFNFGPGLWFDYGNRDVTINECIIFGNQGVTRAGEGPGIMLEIGENPARIFENDIYSNGGHGMLFSENGTHEDVLVEDRELATVYSNRLCDNYSAFTFKGVDRSEPWELWGVKIGDCDLNNPAQADKPNLIFPQRGCVFQSLSLPSVGSERWDNERNVTIGKNLYINRQEPYLREIPGGSPALVKSASEMANLGWDVDSEEIDESFERLSVPRYTFYHAFGGDSLGFGSSPPPASREAAYSTLTNGSSPGQLIHIPIFSRGSLEYKSGSSAQCLIYDIFENSLTLELPNLAAIELANLFPFTPLTRPIYVSVRTTVDSGVVTLVSTPRETMLQ